MSTVVNTKNIQISYNVIGSKAVAKAPYNEEQLKDVFKKHDTNKDGLLSREELTKAFSSLGSFFPSWRASRALSHVDKNRDGFVDENEFSDLVRYVAQLGYVYTME
ncbi:putative calcium-binding protein CML27 [Morus notabilis]|uniref:Putative calcium-binding protein CML27 n=1 Tax=Morus notabilis TaxID=981085 RepID=W9RZZ8_9ROSA|nr:putative calcium-binding protein CML27 [Morus notabilis]